ncbi:MAG: DUF882 domain-containing protein [Pseudomonadota bacterium]|nr:DUF882 domain-containing protein [Pseudomonadota bacterium]
MPFSKARKASFRKTSRAAQRLALTASLVLLGCETLQDAVANGDTRTISLHHVHTGEDLKITYKRNGRYDDEALKKINWVLRDWRRNEEIRMDPHLIDLVWEVHRDLNAKEAIEIICGYRAPQTNAMLRRRSGGVARVSQHMAGKAIDFGIPGVPLEDLRAAGLRLQRGGVGFYPSSGSPFVHLDVGSVRHWPRMTRDQLVRVFPTGRTVHIPSDGNPLPGYELALADIDKRGGTPSALSLAAVDRDGSTANAAPKRNLFAKIFGGRDKDEDDEADATTASARPSASAKARAPAIERREPAKAEAAPAREATPLPKTRPANTQVAALPAPPEQLAKPSLTARIAAPALSANDIIEARGYWQGLPEPTPRSAPVELSAARQRPIQTASADPTASIGPFPAPDRVPADVALAYAAQAELPVRRPEPMGSAMPRPVAVGASGTSIARKSSGDRPSEVQSTPVAPWSGPAMVGDRFDEPWLRAVTMTPSLQGFMNTTLLGTPNFRELRPLFRKPATALVMTFSADPHLGMTSEKFSGSAVVFLATATFVTRTAALQ